MGHLVEIQSPESTPVHCTPKNTLTEVLQVLNLSGARLFFGEKQLGRLNISLNDLGVTAGQPLQPMSNTQLSCRVVQARYLITGNLYAEQAYPVRPKLPPQQKQRMTPQHQARAGPRRHRSPALPRQVCKSLTTILLGQHLPRPMPRASSMSMWSEFLK